jgi:branched-chain amino acid aminotransferase
MSDKVFLNDRIVDVGQAHISPTDSGFLYGAGLFETMRSHNGVVFRLADHLDRLFRSAAHLAINHNYDKTALTDAVYDVLRANSLNDARLRLTLTNGPITQTVEQAKPTLLITATPLQRYPDEYYQTGVTVVLCPYRQNTTEPICGHKTTDYYPRLLALTLARQQEAAEALWFTTDNCLAEGCVSNVFLVSNAVLYTPKLGTPVLPGIARKTIGEIAARDAIDLVEKDLYIADVLAADEVFLTNVVMEVMPVVNVEKHTVGQGKVGPLTGKLHRMFLQTIEDECRSRE